MKGKGQEEGKRGRGGEGREGKEGEGKKGGGGGTEDPMTLPTDLRLWGKGREGDREGSGEEGHPYFFFYNSITVSCACPGCKCNYIRRRYGRMSRLSE
jgi:hypothetical protein